MAEGNVMSTDASREAKAAKAPAEKMVPIILDNNTLIPTTGLPIGHNGTTWLLKPGVRAEVPERVVNVLKDAVVSMPIIDEQTNQLQGFQDQMRYPFRRLDN